MMIQGLGISCRVSFTHRHHRAARVAASEKIALLKYRNEFCKAHDMSRAEYMARLARWCEIRQIVTQERARDAHTADRDFLRSEMKEKLKQRVTNRARAAEAQIEKRARENFARHIMPID